MDERQDLIAQILERDRELFRLMHSGRHSEWLEIDITMAQLKTMLVLFGMGKASMGELADSLGTGVSTMTGIVDRLVDHGFVGREEDAHDRRVVVSHLTPAGQAVLDRLYLMAKDRMGVVLNQLSNEELLHVAQAVNHLCSAARTVSLAGIDRSAR